jgi:DNA-binding response OmpR family regulator
MKPKSRPNAALVIDDDPNCREMIQTLGLVWGVPVLQASNCKEGLKVIRCERSRIKLILLDYFMPGMEPAKCVASIIAAAGSSTQIVLMTAAADPAMRVAQLKVHQFLSKPFEMSSLQALLTA